MSGKGQHLAATGFPLPLKIAGRKKETVMLKKSARFAGPFLASIGALALIAPTAAVAQRGDSAASKSKLAASAKSDSALKLSPRRFQDERRRRDGRPKDGPPDTGIKRGQDGHPTSP